MAKARKLRNPPIKEAVVDITVLFDALRPSEEFSRLGELLKPGYPSHETRFNIHWKIGGNNAPSQGDSSVVAYMYRSTDGASVVQSKVDGFAFSRLQPYSDWQTMFEEAWRVWQLYRDSFRPTRVLRVATRYINRLDLPGPQIDFDEYLTVAPRLPDTVPPHLSAFSTVLNIPEIAPKTLGVLRIGYDGGTAPGSAIPIVLDIDIIRECDSDPADDASLRLAIEDLRPLKNNIFFGSLTDKAVELFE